MNQHKKPCAECPFRRGIKPGFLGGSPVETYIGQSVLPFWLPCHCDENYKHKASKIDEVTQCAGTAIFRSNLGVAPLMPDSLLNLPADKESITCLRCERTSHNPNDVEHRYCGFCNMFHDDIWPPARAYWIKQKLPAAKPGESNQL